MTLDTIIRSQERRARALRSGAAFGLALCLLGCSKTEDTSGTPAPTTVPAAKALPATAEGVLAGYENVRKLLAEDQIAAVSAFAQRLTTAAQEVVANKTAPQLATFERIAGASATLSAADAKDPDAVRRQFGEVSRAVVELLTEDEALRASRYVFECPMAQGYRKWVQQTPTIHNPYMGAKMLECGSASQWTR